MFMNYLYLFQFITYLIDVLLLMNLIINHLMILISALLLNHHYLDFNCHYLNLLVYCPPHHHLLRHLPDPPLRPLRHYHQQ